MNSYSEESKFELFQREMPLQWVLENFRPGSQDPPWSWEDERSDMLNVDHIGRTADLLVKIRKDGQFDPICLGSDRRIWDGHHRIIVHQILGLKTILCEGTADDFLPSAVYSPPGVAEIARVYKAMKELA